MKLRIKKTVSIFETVFFCSVRLLNLSTALAVCSQRYFSTNSSGGFHYRAFRAFGWNSPAKNQRMALRAKENHETKGGSAQRRGLVFAADFSP
jgi:hypothetical protein